MPATNEPRRPPPAPTWRDRLESAVASAGLDVSPARVAATAAAIALVAVAAFMLLRPAGASPPVEDSLPRAEPSSATAPPVTTAEIVVQAAGAVVHPGVYRVPSTARVNDLVQLAGGFTADADPDRVALAAPMTDGERVYVPRVGETPPPVAGDGDTAPGAPAGKVDLNRASLAELETLPGIGPVLAQAIIDYRSAHRGFRSVDELADVRGIGPARMEQLRPLVTISSAG